MVFIIRRREAMAFGAMAAALALARQATGQAIPKADVAAPKWPVEKGASLRMLRPARFVEPDEVIFRANSAKFAKETGVEVKVDLVGWEDIRQQTAVSANTGAGPDLILNKCHLSWRDRLCGRGNDLYWGLACRKHGRYHGCIEPDDRVDLK